MHVRLASNRDHRGVTIGAGAILVSLLIVGLGATGCAGGRGVIANDVTIDVTMNPPAAAAGGDADTRAVLTIRDRSRQPVRGAVFQVEAFMPHPGMAPVGAAAVERGDGVYDVSLRLTMRGDWTLLVNGTLPDGRRLSRRIEVPGVRP